MWFSCVNVCSYMFSKPDKLWLKSCWLSCSLSEDLNGIMNTENNMYSALPQSSEEAFLLVTDLPGIVRILKLSCDTVKVAWAVCMEIAFPSKDLLIVLFELHRSGKNANVLQTARIHWRVPVLLLLLLLFVHDFSEKPLLVMGASCLNIIIIIIIIIIITDLPIIPSAPKCSSRHFIFHRKCVCFE